jgi:polyisoprenoid-binding protein YceI
VRNAFNAIFLIGLITATSIPYLAHAIPVQQTLSRSSSSIKFGIDSPSPTLQLNGSFTDFKGTLQLDPENLERSLVQLTLNIQSAQLRPDQILQNIFLQTALSRVDPPTTTFKSTSIRKDRGDTFLVTGAYTWMGKSKTTSIPIRLVRSSASSTEIQLLLNGTLKDKEAPQELQALAPDAKGSKGWAKATLVFVRELARRG